ncbi:MAG: hypothetical protein GXX89_01675 [Clostridiales bacterium]|jgi:hypothetical protein|nr:hypothetical protein [Clostridiales bacterium]
MSEKDTIKLLRACGAEARTGIAALTDALRCAEDTRLRLIIAESRNERAKTGRIVNGLLDAYGYKQRYPAHMSSGLHRLKTAIIANTNPTDSALAKLVERGCGAGIKYLSRRIGRFDGASAAAGKTACDLIESQRQLSERIQPYTLL